MALTDLKATRGRRPTRRSRFGCRNCKLRKLKCDETKPQCKRCLSFGLLCAFLPNVPDLQPTTDDSMRLVVPRGNAQFRLPIASPIFTYDDDAVAHCRLEADCRNFVNRYLSRGLIAPYSSDVVEANRTFLKLAHSHPFLMHASIAISLAHTRHLTNPTNTHPTLEEHHHWTKSTILFNRRLKQPIPPQDKDPIWGTAAALAMLTFSSPDAHTPEDSWPLRSPETSDLEWLRMNRGKMSLWRITDPLRVDSLFSVFAATYARIFSPLPERGVDGIPTALTILCQLDESSTAESNPYFDAAHAVSRVLNVPDDQVTTGHTELFVQSIHGGFESLLWGKDPVALLLLYFWLGKTGRCMWWAEARARMECRAICEYLRVYHSEYHAVQAFLPGGEFSELWSE